MTVERGLGSSLQSKPAPLLEAEAILAKSPARHRDDPRWMESQARAALLEWDHEFAIREIDDALTLKPEDPELLVDRATALFERASENASGASFFLSMGANDLSKVLKQSPDNLTALFNRALLYERLFLMDEASEDFGRYLELEPKGEWAEEARERRRKIDQRIGERAAAGARIPDDPGVFLQMIRGKQESSVIEARIEEYLQVALKQWLPEAYPRELNRPGREEAIAALQNLATILATRHGDAWLKDVLRQAQHSTSFARAANALSASLSQSEKGEKSDAYDAATEAVHWFRVAGSPAGVMRAEVEEAYALRNTQAGEACIAEEDRIEKNIENSRYAWLRAQFEADHASCSLMVGQFEQARSYASRAVDSSTRSSYSTLRLRSLGIMASVENDEGNLLEAWGIDEAGLGEYWDRKTAPVLRAQQFYDDLSYSAINENEVETALAFAKESVRSMVLAGDQTLEGMTRAHLGEIAAKSGLLSLADEEMRLSADLLRPVIARPKMLAFRILSEAEHAQIELREGKVTQASDRLEVLRQDIKTLDSFTVSRAYYKAEAEVLIKQGKLDAAEEALRHGISIADNFRLRLTEDNQRSHWIEENSELYRTLVGLELLRGKKRDALAVWEWYRSAHYGTDLPDRDLQSFLQNEKIDGAIYRLHGETVLSYSLVPRGLAVWVFDDRGVESQVIPVDAVNLRALISQFTAMCRDPQSDVQRLQSTGRKIFDVILAPVLARLEEQRRIVIETDNFLDDVPFEALVADDGHYFGERFLTSFSPGLLYPQDLCEAARLSPAARSLFIGSTADFAGPGGPTPQSTGAVAEVETEAALFSQPVLLKGKQSTAEALEKAIADAELVHFAGHAISTTTSEGIVVFAAKNSGGAETELWNASRVSRQALKKCKLVVLSACSTGKAYRGRKEKHGELVRSFLSKGVPNVVGSRWDVDSEATSRFMSTFYRTLLAGEPVTASIRQAEREIREQMATRHPYYWAAFAVFGR